ncbi:type II toxin-antitoxin system VapC family toxin [Spirulina sp. CS-785/01]|uniref:type II toxin-antitoxin system VapC family toxin n=1 Tax=Spirulina sp. CS-785/01 TaxID=3021716 RepID=UPI00232DC2B8|nr:type II toxin-antitoxin system VapC family toxin [Spirulina sp. CS-785/01]MDB9313908.1 type II toxin-antitoxin system VapC family toxin [Spirulina sp. CS-785/01]
MIQYVVDANVVIKWVLPEIHSNDALRLRNPDYQLLVPDFGFSEIGNILWKRVRKGELSLEEAKVDFNAMISYPWRIHQSYFLIPQALEIATRVNQAVYDCIYLALAVQHNVKW